MLCCLKIMLAACCLCFGVTAVAQNPSATGLEFFENRVRPLLIRHCYSCHSRQSGTSEGNLLLDSQKGWQHGGDQGPALVPGEPDNSLLIRAVRYADADLQMPPKRTLSKEDISLLEHWISIGAPDPRSESAAPAVKPSDPVAGRKHWAFRTLTPSQVPVLKNDSWPRTTIDSFVLAALDTEGLSPSPDADQRTMCRRLYFQLHGLPPSQQQMDEFLSDSRPDSVKHLVDQLLDSPAFGQRWGRHWLDLARYADSNGLDENFLFREAWRYRNWVIDAVNEDKRIDEFILEQIAGDLLPFDSIEQRDQQRIATGFLAMGPKVLLGNSADERIMDVADEQLDTIGKTVLGQTLGCARCHDHKFDPIPTADYYALAGIFTSTRVMETRYMLGQQRNMEQLVGLGTDGEQTDDEYEAFWRERDKRTERVKQGKAALELLQKDDTTGLASFAESNSDVVAASATLLELPKEERIQGQQKRIAELEAAAKPQPIPPRAMIASESSKPANEHIRLAGQFDQRRTEVNRGFLKVFGAATERIPENQSGRLQLGTWLTNVETGAGRMAARVLSNRIWHHLIGRGIVRTVDNFGRSGEPPTHPELLDHLAKSLIDSDWSTKSLIRRIVLSRTFAMSSQHDDHSHSVDPENRWLWRAHRRRLDPESFRDAMLSVAGNLELEQLDSTVSYLGDQATAVGKNENRRRTDFKCRTVYLPVIRNDLPELLNVFDFADPHATTGMRPKTMVATQGLFVLNDESVMQAAEETARRLLATADKKDNPQLVTDLFELVLNSTPDERERDDVLVFLDASVADQPDDDGEAILKAWTMVCHALFASSRFQLLE